MFHSHAAREIKGWMWTKLQPYLRAEWLQTGSALVFELSDTDTAIVCRPETCLV